jgi:RNA polymerase sigma-70 factor (ECF subfamily)
VRKVVIESLATARAAVLRELPDEEVARRVVEGEVELFELLLRRYNQRLFRVARGIVATDAEAEDVLQDAWVRAYQHLAGFRGEARLATWLSRIAAHEALARVRRGRRFVALSSAAEDELPASAAGDPETLAMNGELRAALEAAISALPPRYRSVFLLRAIEGLSTAETAASLELSEETVKVRLHRARARLRQDLERRLGEAARALFGFAAERCDRLVAAVLARIGAGD